MANYIPGDLAKLLFRSPHVEGIFLYCSSRIRLLRGRAGGVGKWMEDNHTVLSGSPEMQLDAKCGSLASPDAAAWQGKPSSEESGMQCASRRLR